MYTQFKGVCRSGRRVCCSGRKEYLCVCVWLGRCSKDTLKYGLSQGKPPVMTSLAHRRRDRPSQPVHWGGRGHLKYHAVLLQGPSGQLGFKGFLIALSAAGQRRCGTDSQPKGTKSSPKAPRPPAHNLNGREGRFFHAWSCPLRSRGTISQVKFV